MDELPLFTEASLSDMWGDSPASCKKLIGYYMEDMPQGVSRIEAALAANRTGEVRDLAHSLKSSSLQIGAMRIGAAAASLEQAARGTCTADDLEPLVRQMRRLTAPTMEVLATRMGREGKGG